MHVTLLFASICSKVLFNHLNFLKEMRVIAGKRAGPKSKPMITSFSLICYWALTVILDFFLFSALK